jgi:hypothetical protein
VVTCKECKHYGGVSKKYPYGYIAVFGRSVPMCICLNTHHTDIIYSDGWVSDYDRTLGTPTECHGFEMMNIDCSTCKTRTCNNCIGGGKSV